MKIEPTFGPTSSWAEKFAALTAGGDLPDLCWLYPQDPRGVAQYRTIQQGAFTDLTPYVTGDALKEYPNLATFPANAWRNIAINGKIYGVPRPNFLVATLTYRQDWLDKLGLAKPTNADQFLGLLTAFTKNDPNGNGAPDTFGLGSIVPAHLMSLNFVRYMFRVPDQWRKNADNTLTASIETEEYKGALAFARRLHEAGVYHPDAPTMTPAQARDSFDAGKFGAFNAAITGLSGRRENSKKVNPAADPRLLIPFGHDGDKAIAYNGAGHVGWTAISAKAGRDRERVKELLRILDYYAAPFGSEERIFLNYGLEGMHHTVRPDGSRAVTDAGRVQIGDLPNLTNQAPVFYYDEPGLAPYMQGTLRDLYAIGIDNPTVNLYAPLAGTKGAELNQLVNDKEIAFITGREPLSAIDAFVRDWRNRGGDQIRKEYEQALKA